MLKRRAKEDAKWGWTNGELRFLGGPKGRRARVCKGSAKAAYKMAEAMEEYCQATGKCFRPRTGPRKKTKTKKKGAPKKCVGGMCPVVKKSKPLPPIPQQGGLLTVAPKFTIPNKALPRPKNKFPHGPTKPLPSRPLAMVPAATVSTTVSAENLDMAALVRGGVEQRGEREKGGG